MYFTVSPQVDQLVFTPRFQPARCTLEERVFPVEIRRDLKPPLDICKFIPVELIWFQQESGGYPPVEVYRHPGRRVDGAREAATRLSLKEQFGICFIYQFHRLFRVIF